MPYSVRCLCGRMPNASLMSYDEALDWVCIHRYMDGCRLIATVEHPDGVKEIVGYAKAEHKSNLNRHLGGIVFGDMGR